MTEIEHHGGQAAVDTHQGDAAVVPNPPAVHITHDAQATIDGQQAPGGDDGHGYHVPHLPDAEVAPEDLTAPEYAVHVRVGTHVDADGALGRGAQLVQEINAWGDAASNLTELDDLAVTWEQLQELKAAVTLTESLVAPKLHEAIPKKPGWAETPAGIVKREFRGRTTRWDDRAVTERLVSRVLAKPDPETGELVAPESPPPEVAEVVTAIAKAAGVSYWRVGALQELGVIPSDRQGSRDALAELREQDPGRPWVSRV